jgi:actin-like ATPase involved in cell morphogenesis
MTEPVTRAVGVDFGTSTSLVAERDGAGAPEVLPLGQRTRYVPSVVGLRGDDLVVGEPAESLAGDRAIRSIKRFLTQNRDTVELLTADGVASLAVDDVAVRVLSEVASRADREGLPLSAERLVRIGCPAGWTGAQRTRLLRLATRAGIPVSHASLVDEPVAAGIAWLTYRWLAHSEAVEGRALIFDMGGGTLDIAVLDVVGGADPSVRVLASVGLPEAGDDLDRELAADLRELGGVDIDSDPRARQVADELLRLARAAKIRLSEVAEVPIALDPALFGEVGPLRYTRAQLEAVFEPQLNRALDLASAALRAARLAEELAPSPMELRRMSLEELAHDVRYVVLAGGMSRIPVVARRLEEALPKAEVHAGIGHLAADELVVGGLADTAGYDRISLHRPAFDFVLEWGDQRRVLYQAYSPLYQPWRVALGDTFLGHDWYGSDLPREGTGTIRVYTPTGEAVRLDLAGSGADGLQVRFGHAEFIFKIYTNGRIHVTDGSGAQYAARVGAWPMIRGADHEIRETLALVRDAAAPLPAWSATDRAEGGADLDIPAWSKEDRVVSWSYQATPEEDRWYTEPEELD